MKIVDFLYSKKIIWYLTIFLFISLLFILVFNILSFDPIYGYDAEAHLNYIDHFSRYLPREISFPNQNESREFFNPPLPYINPSIAQVICRNIISSSNFLEDCQPIYTKSSQVFQTIIYLITLFINMSICNKLTKNKKFFSFNYLILISLLAVNYRTISMIRGEPYILFFMSLLFYYFLKISDKNFDYKFVEIFIFGLIIGFLALSRQWAFLLFPSFLIVYFYIDKKYRNNFYKFISLSFIIGFIFSGWFYFYLFFEYGSFTAFNKEITPFRLSNQPLSFYFSSFADLNLIFEKPIRPNFSNQLIPILYSDLWGDYWGYFVFTSRFTDIGRNQMLIGDYLARVNMFSLAPSLFFLMSFIKFRKNSEKKVFVTYLFYSIIVSFFGYLWFLISYPEFPTGDTIKATYIIQMFNIFVLLGAFKLDEIKKNNHKLYTSLIILFLIVYVHNYSSYLSHFPISF